MKKEVFFFLIAMISCAQAFSAGHVVYKKVKKRSFQDQCTQTVTQGGTITFYCVNTKSTTVLHPSVTCTRIADNCESALSAANTCAEESIGALTKQDLDDLTKDCQNSAP